PAAHRATPAASAQPPARRPNRTAANNPAPSPYGRNARYSVCTRGLRQCSLWRFASNFAFISVAIQEGSRCSSPTSQMRSPSAAESSRRVSLTGDLFDHDTGTNRHTVLPPHRVEVVLVQRIQAQRALAGLLLQEPGPMLLAPRAFQAVQQCLGSLQG